MTPQVALLLAVLLAGWPLGECRGGKAGKGTAGGSHSGYNSISNSIPREMTWEDIVLAMQLTAMCLGALIALCVVACCAYKICGPAEELEYGSHYAVLKKTSSSSSSARQAPEIVRDF